MDLNVTCVYRATGHAAGSLHLDISRWLLNGLVCKSMDSVHVTFDSMHNSSQSATGEAGMHISSINLVCTLTLIC